MDARAVRYLAGVLLLRASMHCPVRLFSVAAFIQEVGSYSGWRLVLTGRQAWASWPEAGRQAGCRRRRSQAGSFTFRYIVLGLVQQPLQTQLRPDRNFSHAHL